MKPKRSKMNNDAVINRIAYATGCSRKEVLSTLKKLGILKQPQSPLHKHGASKKL